MYPRYFIFVNFAGFLLIFSLLTEPIKAIAISVVAALMINIIICLMIKPLIENIIKETEERVKTDLQIQSNKIIGYEIEAINQRVRKLVYEALNRTSFF